MCGNFDAAAQKTYRPSMQAAAWIIGQIYPSRDSLAVVNKYLRVAELA